MGLRSRRRNPGMCIFVLRVLQSRDHIRKGQAYGFCVHDSTSTFALKDKKACGQWVIALRVHEGQVAFTKHGLG